MFCIFIGVMEYNSVIKKLHIYSYVGETQKHYIEGKKQDSKDCMLHNFIYMKTSRSQN